VNSQLEGRQYLTGENFCVADAYLYTVSRWTKPLGIDISALRHLGDFMQRMEARPAVQAALKAEGLIK
jgi:glutathione S-transferase